ncbi:MAG: phosphotransferase [Saprospiraceae bacterium]|nr:phosphotransferase [Saprospiraceae bacterium]
MIRNLLADIIREPFDLTPVPGGDINEAFLVTSGDQEFFIKYHCGSYASDMFDKELVGLDLINKAVPGFAPQAHSIINDGDHALLIMEYLKAVHKGSDCGLDLGQRLAEMHQYESEHYGLESGNYIGSLTQKNDYADSISEFMAQSRFQPQLQMARDRGYLIKSEIPSLDRMERVLNEIIPEEKPCLVHGDLWGGNYLCVGNGKAMIIDPAVAYAHRELDIAMSRLFGGFDDKFYNSYNDTYPLAPGWENRIDLFQLYYLLVHLNLFGTSYKGSVMRILRKYFG